MTKPVEPPDQDWKDEALPSRTQRTVRIGLTIALILFWAFVLKWPAIIVYTIIKTRVEHNSMEPKEIVLASDPDNRKLNKHNLPDSAFAKLAIPNKFIHHSSYQAEKYYSSVNIQTNADTLGQGLVDKIYALDKLKWPNGGFTPPSFTLWGHSSGKREVDNRISVLEGNAISTTYDAMFKIILTARTNYNQKSSGLVPEFLIFVPREVERERNIYIQCPYDDERSFCLIKDEIDQKITVESLINRNQLADWKLLRDATRQFAMKYYLNP